MTGPRWLGVLLLVAFAACNSPTYLKLGRQSATPYSVCGARSDGGWGFSSPIPSYGSRPTAPAVIMGQRGALARLEPDRTCTGVNADCRWFWLATLDAGIYSFEECSRSRVTIEESVDGGDLIEAIAWCPSGLVRLKAESTGPCPPTYIY